MGMKGAKTGILDKPTLCYIGDLPDKRVDGITMTFNYNLSILSDYFLIQNVPEKSSLYSNKIGRFYQINSFWLRSFRQLQTLKPSIVYLNLPTSTLGLIKVFLIAIFSKRKGAKIIAHLHRGDLLNKINSSNFFRKLLSSLIQKTDRIIVLSKKESTRLNNMFNTTIFIALPNTIEAPPLVKTPSEKRSGFLFISNYLENKGIFDLLEVFDSMSPNSEKLSCYGTFSSDTIKKKISQYSSSHISISGPVNGIKKFEVMNGAKIFVLPSWNEGQPLVILEAMSQGLPVIATDVGFIRDLLGNDYPFLYPAKNKVALKQTIIAISKQKDLDKIGAQLKERFYDLFSPTNHKTALLKIFKPYLI